MSRVLGVVFLLVVLSQGLPIDNVKKSESVDPLVENIHETIYKVNKDDDLNLFEADIKLSPDHEEPADLSNSGDIDGGLLSKRNAVRDRKRIWLNKVVPYEFDYSFTNKKHQQAVLEAMKIYQNHTCIRFKPRTSERQWILFVHKKGCWSAVGRSYWLDGSGQEISLGNGCDSVGTALHEIMHALGFWHEQSRPDRNQYVEVLWENIVEGEAYNFNKYSHGVVDTLKIPYDFESIMHYGTHSFTKNNLPTIRSIRTPDRSLGQRNGLTKMDIQELNALYDCQESDSPWSSWSDFGACSISDCTKYRQRFCTSDNKQTDCPGADYFGVQTEIVKCSDAECHAPIDGHWGRWSSWGECNVSCGSGTQTRKRLCDDPKPQYNGKDCVGNNTDAQMCKKRTCGLGAYDCEFDADLFCHWSEVSSSSNFQWERGTGSTPTSGTGPSGDHTSGTGFYLYTEASSPASPGNKARLLSKEFEPTEGRCLSFWYNMNGGGMGSLSIMKKDADGEHELWKESGDKGSDWRLGRVTLESNTTHKVLFEAVRGSDFMSDFAIDDVKFEDGPCIEEVGCYQDNPNDRTFPVLYENLRGKIDWFNIRATVINKCATLAHKRHYKYFAVQFYGECWGGSPKVDLLTQKTSPDSCVLGVGKELANFAYKIQ